MKDKELIAKIKKLQKIEPNQNWLNSTREELDFKTEDDSFSWGVFGAPKLVTSFLVFLIVILVGPWALLKTAQDSVPGDALYSIKKTAEEIQVKLPGANRMNLQTQFANRRLEELSKVNLDDFSLPEEKNQNAQEAINGLKENLVEISSKIDKTDENSKKEIVEIAQKTKQQIQEENQDQSPEDIQKQLSELEEITNKILTALQQEKTGSSTPELLDEKNSTTTTEVIDNTTTEEDKEDSTEETSTSTLDN